MTEEARLPVKTVETCLAHNFECECAELVEQGYELASTICGFASEDSYWLAIFVLPEVKGDQ